MSCFFVKLRALRHSGRPPSPILSHQESGALADAALDSRDLSCSKLLCCCFSPLPPPLDYLIALPMNRLPHSSKRQLSLSPLQQLRSPSRATDYPEATFACAGANAAAAARNWPARRPSPPPPPHFPAIHAARFYPACPRECDDN